LVKDDVPEISEQNTLDPASNSVVVVLYCTIELRLLWVIWDLCDYHRVISSINQKSEKDSQIVFHCLVSTQALILLTRDKAHQRPQNWTLMTPRL